MFNFFLDFNFRHEFEDLITFLDNNRKLPQHVLGGLAILFLCAVSGCQTVPPLPPVDLAASGWTVRNGQAVWHLPDGTELAGELLAARGQDGREYVQFTKNPF